MKNLKSYEIRQMWLDFFKSKGHLIEPSASLVPVNDPTLLWTNAGVTPLKKYFDGSVVPPNNRLTNAQKCIRTNDIENVGKTARHHTFFEMLGNFSIGDYFKEEAIKFATEILFDQKYFAFDKNKIYITYYTEDIDAKENWIKNGVALDHLIPLKSNFWEIGSGPCGPDTEMFYDRGEKYDKRGKELIEKDIENDRFIEIWNIVFSQFNSQEGVDRKDYKELPKKNIDTGAGLERLCCVMQGCDTNYETDLFMPIINKTEEISKVKYEGQMAFKVIADHVRTLVFALADGAMFSNEGRGYVLRRVLRRAAKYAKKLGIHKPFMSDLVDVVIDIMDPFYPYLKDKSVLIKKMINAEEVKFLETLEDGEKKFNLIASKSDKIISGEDAFTLYDTFGFPIELTVEYAEELGLKVDIDSFNKSLLNQKKKAKEARADISSMKGQNEEFLAFKDKSTFIGYSDTETKAKVIAKFGNDVVLDNTPFYAFSGGQLSDSGYINEYLVKDVIKMPNGQNLHILDENDLNVGDIVDAKIDLDKRTKTRKNHSAAHLLQAALKEVLGPHVMQQGSQVCDTYSRFDFNNYEALTDEEILKIEDLVNSYIDNAYDVNTLVLPIEEAKKLGATALFDEKYGDVVRVVIMGNVSKEFCGGTHVFNTKDVEKYAIYSYESIGSGIFRITASTSDEAMKYVKEESKNVIDSIKAFINKQNELIAKAKNEGIVLKAKLTYIEPTEFGYRYVLKLRENLKEASYLYHELEKEYNNLQSKNALKDLDQFDKEIDNNNLFAKTNQTDVNLIKDMAYALVNNKSLDIVLLASVNNNKLTFVCATSPKVNAVDVIKEATKITGGGGGGKPNMAQAGGKEIAKLDEAIAHLKELYR